MNVKLLRKIQRQILRTPEQFQMEYWFLKGGDIPNCGTAACLAGWAVSLFQKTTPSKVKKTGIEAMAARVLDLKGDAVDRLFAFCFWPSQFRNEESNNAMQAVARIDHFIKTDGAE